MQKQMRRRRNTSALAALFAALFQFVPALEREQQFFVDRGVAFGKALALLRVFREYRAVFKLSTDGFLLRFEPSSS